MTKLYQCDKFLSTNLVRFAEWGVSAPSQSWMTNDPAILSSGSLGAYRHHQRVIDSSCLSSTIHIAIICNTFCFHNIYIYILLKLTNFCKFLFFFCILLINFKENLKYFVTYNNLDSPQYSQNMTNIQLQCSKL